MVSEILVTTFQLPLTKTDSDDDAAGAQDRGCRGVRLARTGRNDGGVRAELQRGELGHLGGQVLVLGHVDVVLGAGAERHGRLVADVQADDLVSQCLGELDDHVAW